MTTCELEALSISVVLERLRLPFQERSSYFSLCCPYHGEKNPSAVIRKEHQNFRCYACGKKRSLAGLYSDLTGERIELGKPSLLNESLLKTNPQQDEGPFFLEVEGSFTPIDRNPIAQWYCQQRGITSEYISAFQLTTVDSFMRIKGSFADPTDPGTPFRQRLITPIYHGDELLSYEGRDYTREAKPKVLYPKGAPPNTIFDFANLDQDSPLVLVEGLVDHAVLWSYGMNVSCYFGASLSVRQLELIDSFKRIVLFIDDDVAGERVIDTVDSFFNGELRVAVLPGKDPKEATENEAWSCVEHARDLGDYMSERYEFFQSRPILF